MTQAGTHRIRPVDRAYTVLMDQLQDAFDDELRFKVAGRPDQVLLAQERVQSLIERITVMLNSPQT